MIPASQQTYPHIVWQGIALILRMALDTPLRRVFDYLPRPDTAGRTHKLGVRCACLVAELIGVRSGVSHRHLPFPQQSSSPRGNNDDEPVFDRGDVRLRASLRLLQPPAGPRSPLRRQTRHLRLGQAAGGARRTSGGSLSEARHARVGIAHQPPFAPAAALLKWPRGTCGGNG